MEGARIVSREAAIRDRQGAVLRAAEMRREPGDCSGCEGRCAFPGWSAVPGKFAGPEPPGRGPAARTSRAGLGLGGALLFLCFCQFGIDDNGIEHKHFSVNGYTGAPALQFF